MPDRSRRPERRLLEISVLKKSPCEKRSLQGESGKLKLLVFFFLKKGMFSCFEKKKKKKPASSINDFVHWPHSSAGV